MLVATSAASRKNLAVKRIATAMDQRGIRRNVAASMASVTARDRKVRAVISALHVALAVAAHIALWRGLERESFVIHGPGPDVATAFATAVLIASGFGSVAAIVAGRAT